MEGEVRPIFVIKTLVLIIILLIISNAVQQIYWINSSYNYEIPESEIINTNTNNIGGVE